MIQTALYRNLFIKQCRAARFLNNVRSASSSLDFNKMIKKKKVVVFMKGTPELPQCGFSKAVVSILKLYDVEFEAHDVLVNEQMRQGIKDYTSWQTIPQVFINGEFVGGCDILLQMHYDNKLSSELEKAGIKFGISADGETKEKNKN